MAAAASSPPPPRAWSTSARQTARFKDSARPQGAQKLIGGFGLLPSALRAPVLRAVQPGRFNLTISSVPGPPGALSMHGMRLDELYPVIPIAEDQTLSIGMLPYEGHLYFGLYADPDGLPEATRLAELIDDELRALRSRAAPRRAGAPAAAGRRTRHRRAARNLREPIGRADRGRTRRTRMTTAPHSTRRLSALDGSFLRLDTPQSPMHVGLERGVRRARGDRPRPTIEALRERAAGRVHEVPWCRWRLDESPLGLTEPRWIDDAGFDLSAHIVQLTEPDDRGQHASFEALRSTVLSTPLDRSRPLWQIFLVPRLEDGRIGMVGKIHHALVDGIAALQIVRLFVDPEPDMQSRPPVRWQPAGRGGADRLGARRRAAAPSATASACCAPARGRRRIRAARRARAARSAKLIATAIAEDVLPRGAARRSSTGGSARAARSSAITRRATCCAPRAGAAGRSTTSA